MATGVLGGPVAAIPGNSGVYVFAGPTATVTTAAGQRLTGASEAPIGLPSGSAAQTANVDLCYQPNAGGALINFSGGNYSIHRFVGERRAYTAVGTVVPGAGTWKVGMCVQNNGPAQISDNDFVNGYVQVTN